MATLLSSSSGPLLPFTPKPSLVQLPPCTIPGEVGFTEETPAIGMDRIATGTASKLQLNAIPRFTLPVQGLSHHMSPPAADLNDHRIDLGFPYILYQLFHCSGVLNPSWKAFTQKARNFLRQSVEATAPRSASGSIAFLI